MKEIRFTELEVEQIFNFLANSPHRWSEVNPLIQMIIKKVQEAKSEAQKK